MNNTTWLQLKNMLNQLNDSDLNIPAVFMVENGDNTLYYNINDIETCDGGNDTTIPYIFIER